MKRGFFFSVTSLGLESCKIIPIFQPINPFLTLIFQDDHLENSRKVPLDRHDIIIDKVAASHDNNYVVAVTSNNMVRIFFLSLRDHPDIMSAKGLGG